MSTNVVITIPNSLFQYHTHLKYFFEGMVRKLDKNSHKKTPTVENVPRIMELLIGEMTEFLDQFEQNKYDENSLIELMDQANFAFLAYVALRMQGVEHERIEIQDRSRDV